MELDNFIQTAMRRVLKNPILSILRDINFSSILKQSNFIKKDIGKSPYMIILHFLYMFIINKKYLHLWNIAMIVIISLFNISSLINELPSVEEAMFETWHIIDLSILTINKLFLLILFIFNYLKYLSLQ